MSSSSSAAPPAPAAPPAAPALDFAAFIATLKTARTQQLAAAQNMLDLAQAERDRLVAMRTAAQARLDLLTDSAQQIQQRIVRQQKRLHDADAILAAVDADIHMHTALMATHQQPGATERLCGGALDRARAAAPQQPGTAPAAAATSSSHEEAAAAPQQPGTAPAAATTSSSHEETAAAPQQPSTALTQQPDDAVSRDMRAQGRRPLDGGVPGPLAIDGAESHSPRVKRRKPISSAASPNAKNTPRHGTTDFPIDLRSRSSTSSIRDDQSTTSGGENEDDDVDAVRYRHTLQQLAIARFWANRESPDRVYLNEVLNVFVTFRTVLRDASVPPVKPSDLTFVTIEAMHTSYCRPDNMNALNTAKQAAHLIQYELPFLFKSTHAEDDDDCVVCLRPCTRAVNATCDSKGRWVHEPCLSWWLYRLFGTTEPTYNCKEDQILMTTVPVGQWGVL